MKCLHLSELSLGFLRIFIYIDFSQQKKIMFFIIMIMIIIIKGLNCQYRSSEIWGVLTLFESQTLVTFTSCQSR